jgi:transmembrane sensor
MSARPDRAVIEQAIGWHLRLRNADESTWLEFAEWLGADPAHNDVYETVVDGEAAMLPLLEKATFAQREERHQPLEVQDDQDAVVEGVQAEAEAEAQAARQRRWRWGSLAASLALAIVVGVQVMPAFNTTYRVETVVGESRSVSLDDGSEVQLNGGTRLVLDRSEPRLVEIAHGEARFTVRHDDAEPFTVVAGEQRLVDLGTVFNVVRTDREVRVGVAEGAVRFEGPARTVDLNAGDTLVADNNGAIDVSRRPVASIGSWADGRLVYDQAPLGQVAEDLSRSIGIPIDLPRPMRLRSFSGVIQIDGNRDAVRARVEDLIGATIVDDGTRWSVATR